MRIRFLILIVFLSFFAKASNDSLKNISFGMNYFGGKIFLHTSKIHANVPPYSQAVELNYNKQTNGNKIWQQRFGFPETALNITISDHGEKGFGYAIGVYPSILFRLVNFQYSYFYFKIGGGIGVNSKHWERDAHNDSTNNILGSAINNFTMMQTGFRFRLNNYWTAQTGFDFYHVSNAGARKPNFGINTYGVFVGTNYHLNYFQNHFSKVEDSHRENPLYIGLQTMGSFAEDKIVDGPIYYNYGLNANISKMYRGKNKVALGAEGVYQSKLYSLFKNKSMYVGRERQAAWQYSVFAMHEFVFGKIGFPMHLGYYLNKPNAGYSIYEKLGITYYPYRNQKTVIKDVYFSLLLKTHYATADYAEWGVGFHF
ncbi:MAG TPA: acyloxyacyl hydrolase [Chitinophagaceae bacterium]|nr:acyloxyacyl hydrolase [Chitinophagaceae bacterium]